MRLHGWIRRWPTATGNAFLLALLAACSPPTPDTATTDATQAAAPCQRPSTDYRPHDDERTLYRLLLAQDFAALESRLDQLRRDYGERYCSDRPFGMAFSTLADGAPQLEASYDAWIAAYPASPHAWAARGSHFGARGWTVRGSNFVRDTKKDRFERMNALFARAEADLNEALRLDPTYTAASSELLANARTGSGVEGALGLYARFAASQPDSYLLATPLLVALTPQWGGSTPLLHEVARHLATRADRNPDMALLPSLAECLATQTLLNDDKHEEALRVLLRARKVHGDNFSPSCWGYLASVQSSLGQDRQAVESDRRSMEALGIQSVVYPARRLEAIGRAEEAEALLRASLEINLGSPTLYCDLASMEMRRERYDAARELVQQGLAILSDHPYCLRMETAVARHLRLDPAQRIARLKEIIDDSQQSAHFHIELGAALLDQHKDAEALAAFDRAIELGNDDAGSLMYRAQAHERLGNLAQALEDANRAVSQSPDDPALLALRARIRIASGGNAPSVIDDMERALASGGVTTEDHYVLAGAYYKRRDCRFIPSLREYLRQCEGRNCNRDNLAFAERMLANPNFRKECPQHFR